MSVKIFKFGGASVKDAAAVRNVASILRMFDGQPLVVVVSAMGKTTNALEEVHDAHFHGRDYTTLLANVREYHEQIGLELFGAQSQGMSAARAHFAQLDKVLQTQSEGDYDQEYDQVVSYGELIATSIIHAYLAHERMNAAWLDARQVVCTDERYRDARVQWSRSAAAAKTVSELMLQHPLIITQGFIGRNNYGLTTTLGREGSDFTAAIFAYLLNAESVTIWKDVPGMLNADPKVFPDAVKLDTISFREAIELAYFGASVIHPRTIQPLQNKKIPLYIKSFIHPEEPGTVIQEKMDFDHLVPSFIFRPQQVLVSITPKDFSFVVEDNLKEIFAVLSTLGIRISLMENSAISFSICIDRNEYKQQKLFDRLRERYEVKYNEGLSLLTIRHYDEATLQRLTHGREILLEQRSRHTVRLVLR